MLTRAGAERMLSATGFAEAAKLLTDCGYEDLSSRGIGALDGALSARRAAIFAEVAHLAPDAAVVDAFRMKYDYHNAKTIVKASAAGTSPDGTLSLAGRVSPEAMRAAYDAQEYGDLPPVLATAMREAREVLARTGDPQAADVLLDRAFFDELSAAAEQMNNAYFTGYVRLLIDRTNAAATVRTARMSKTTEFLRGVLIDGGDVAPEQLLSATAETFASLFASSPLSAAAEAGVAAMQGGSVTAFELACDNAVNAYLARAKMTAYGAEPVVAYLAATENELTAVRMILTGLHSGIPTETIRERLRDFYV